MFLSIISILSKLIMSGTLYWTMTNIPKKKLLVAILPTVVAATVIAYLSMGSLNEAHAATQVQTINVTKASFDVIDNPTSFFARGGKSAVTVEPLLNEVRLTRGSSTVVDLNVQHVASANPFPTVSVKALPPNGYIWYPPSVTASTTLDQRVNAAATGKLIPGSIDLGTLVTFSDPNPAVIQPSGKQVVHMTITLPKDIPDNAVGQGIYLPIPVQVTDSNGNSNTVFADTHGIEVIVGG